MALVGATTSTCPRSHLTAALRSRISTTSCPISAASPSTLSCRSRLRTLSVPLAGTGLTSHQADCAGNLACRPMSGGLVNTWLHNYARCPGNICNHDGDLRCNNGLPVPPGTYTQSCNTVFNDSGDLRAHCKRRDGGWKRPILANFASCRANIRSNDGKLICEKCGGRAPVSRVICYARASNTRLKGVSAALRKRLNPPCITTSRIRFSPACAPSASPTSCAFDAGVHTIVDAQ